MSLKELPHVGRAMRDKALEGVRILDMGMFMAGPFAGKLLADAGAEVIKIESCKHPDLLRLFARGVYPDGFLGDRPWNRSGMINERNRNKYGITLDLTMPEGKIIFQKLVKISDVLLENFTSKVMERFGLDYPVLRRVNPTIIMISMASQGLTGPEKDNLSFGPTLEMLAGLANVSRYPDEPPYFSTVAFPDVLAASLAPGLVVAALLDRERTGDGVHIDLSQLEVATSVTGDTLLDYVMNGRIGDALGNRNIRMAPHGCYRCRGNDRWVTIAIRSDTEWKTLCVAMGKPELAGENRFAKALDRLQNHDELDKIIEEWTISKDHYQVMHLLQGSGLAAGPVLDAGELLNDPHLEERGFFESVTHPESGTHLYTGKPFQLTNTPRIPGLPAPCLGEHNYYVYGELLGLSTKEMSLLEKESIIGDEPTKENLEAIAMQNETS